MNARLSRRALLTATPAFVLLPVSVRAEAAVFYRNPGCGCCHIWSEKMKAAGFAITLVDSYALAAEQAKLGVPEELQDCHAGLLEGYVISGHVPPGDVKRLLAERPKGVGLAVPGMPVGSPGMEGGKNEPYAVLLFQTDGTTSSFATYS